MNVKENVESIYNEKTYLGTLKEILEEIEKNKDNNQIKSGSKVSLLEEREKILNATEVIIKKRSAK